MTISQIRMADAYASYQVRRKDLENKLYGRILGFMFLALLSAGAIAFFHGCVSDNPSLQFDKDFWITRSFAIAGGSTLVLGPLCYYLILFIFRKLNEKEILNAGNKTQASGLVSDPTNAAALVSKFPERIEFLVCEYLEQQDLMALSGSSPHFVRKFFANPVASLPVRTKIAAQIGHQDASQIDGEDFIDMQSRIVRAVPQMDQRDSAIFRSIIEPTLVSALPFAQRESSATDPLQNSYERWSIDPDKLKEEDFRGHSIVTGAGEIMYKHGQVESRGEGSEVLCTYQTCSYIAFRLETEVLRPKSCLLVLVTDSQGNTCLLRTAPSVFGRRVIAGQLNLGSFDRSEGIALIRDLMQGKSVDFGYRLAEPSLPS